MKGKQQGGAHGIYEPNMTPLVDVALVLVVILLVATPMALQSSISVQQSAANARAAEEKKRDERVEVMVVSADTVLVNRKPLLRGELRAFVGTCLDSSTTRSVAVHCREGVTHGTFVGVLDDLKDAGAAQIAVQGR